MGASPVMGGAALPLLQLYPRTRHSPSPEDALSPVTGYYPVAKATRPLLNPPGLRDYGSVTCLLCLMITSFCPQPEGTLKRVPSLGLNAPGCPQMHSSLVPTTPWSPDTGHGQASFLGLVPLRTQAFGLHCQLSLPRPVGPEVSLSLAQQTRTEYLLRARHCARGAYGPSDTGAYTYPTCDSHCPA